MLPNGPLSARGAPRRIQSPLFTVRRSGRKDGQPRRHCNSRAPRQELSGYQTYVLLCVVADEVAAEYGLRDVVALIAMLPV